MPVPTALILADTHVPHFRQELPASLGPYLEACDVILHAGDVTDPAVLDEFAAHAPVLAVRGDGDGPALAGGARRSGSRRGSVAWRSQWCTTRARPVGGPPGLRAGSRARN